MQNDEPYLLLFRAQELGQITALANTITTMSTIVAGVTEVNNPANNFITGQTGETAAEFRTRRNRSLQTPSQGFKESIEGQLLALNDVSDAKVYDNKDDANIDGVQVIVQGGTSNEIGNIIYNNLPPGINTQGAYEATITVNNRNKVLNYNKPNPIPILVKGTIESLTGYPNDVDLDYVKQTLASKQFNIGEIAESANITTELKNILGETGSPYDVELSLGATSAQWSEVTSIDSSLYNDIIYDGSYYIAVGNDSKIATSQDLDTWSIQTVGTNETWVSVTYGDDKFVAVSNNGSIAISTNRTTWNVTTNAVSDVSEFNSINYLNNLFILTGYNGSSLQEADYVISTSDFSNYTKKIVYSSSGNTHWYNTIYADNTYILVGGRNKHGRIAVSSNLTSFNNSKIANLRLYDICYNDGNYVIVGENGYIATSTDLLSFNTTTVGTNNWYSINYYNGLYIAVGENGYIALSEDLTNWTTDRVGTNNWYSIISNNKFIAVGSGVATYTLPSIDWQEILTPTGLADFYVMTVSGMDNLTVLGAD